MWEIYGVFELSRASMASIHHDVCDTRERALGQ